MPRDPGAEGVNKYWHRFRALGPVFLPVGRDRVLRRTSRQIDLEVDCGFIGVSGLTRRAVSLAGRTFCDGDTGCCEEHGDSYERNETSEADVARELVRMAREQGLSLTGSGGLLKILTKTVIDTVLDEEMTEHSGYGKHETAVNETANSRNGARIRTVLTETTGPVEIEVPRDRDGTFTPVILAKRQRQLRGVDEKSPLALCQGPDHGEICAHFAEI